ncbi:MAG: NADH-quinone oxidoreductase subunit NuoF [Anaerolineae bacterium]|nr:NADH-quinone oxidoreductase subunit NuoF [Anaerolineae bacterium]
MTLENTIENLLEPYRGQGREALLPILWDVQRAFGHIGAAHVHQISHVLRVPEAEIYGVIGFYTLFHKEPTGQRIIRICTDPSCALKGADAVLGDLCSRLGVHEGRTTDDGAYTVEHSTCLGMCDHAPAALVSIRDSDDLAVPNISVDSLLSETLQSKYDNLFSSSHNVMLDDKPSDQPQSLDAYDDYSALRKALETQSPETVIESVEHSGLIGRGGAAFPTGLKWKLTRKADSATKYVICNADESEPGTFKDRVLMEQRPHLLLEGIALAAYAVGASEAYIFIRGEYPRAYKVLHNAIDEALNEGLIGEHILGSNFSLHVHLRRGAGAYICGEETALFEALEGKRGFPRIKPPYPTDSGLFGKPTAVNNVETLCAVPAIVTYGADWFKQFGTEKSTGIKLVSVSGHVNQPGVYEISPGITLRQLLDTFCGGVVGDLQAVLMGGAAGTFLTPDDLDVRLTYEDLRSMGSTFGSGAVMVFNQTADIRDVLLRLGKFFQHESCGKCFPCQLGTQRQVEILDRIQHPLEGDKHRLFDVGKTMTEASLCGLGQTAASAVLSAMEKFPALFEAQRD